MPHFSHKNVGSGQTQFRISDKHWKKEWPKSVIPKTHKNVIPMMSLRTKGQPYMALDIVNWAVNSGNALLFERSFSPSCEKLCGQFNPLHSLTTIS